MLACVILASLSLTLLPSLNATTITPLQSPPKFDTYATWRDYMMKLPTPQSGCFAATYPNPSWQQNQCATPPSQPETVGHGNDWNAATGSPCTQVGACAVLGVPLRLIGGVIGIFPFVSGMKSEVDSVKGANYYSLQINSNLFPLSYDGKRTEVGEQFVYESAGNPGNCGTISCGQIYIQYWLIGYEKAYGSCPSVAPLGPGSPLPGNGWTGNEGMSGGNCIFTTAGELTPSVAPYDIGSLTMWAYANVPYSGPMDQVGLCVPTVPGTSYGGKCLAVSRPMAVLNLYQSWHGSEFNIFGYGGSSQAVFNKGTKILVVNILLNQDGGEFGTIPCLKGGVTAESNNLNLDPNTCSAGTSRLSFTESN